MNMSFHEMLRDITTTINTDTLTILDVTYAITGGGGYYENLDMT